MNNGSGTRLIDARLQAARELLDELELDGVAFTTQSNFAWLTGGADSHVATATEAGGASAVITRSQAFVMCDNIEEPRIHDEELGGLGLDVVSYPWWEGGLEERITEMVGSDNWAADAFPGDRESIEAFMYPLRASLRDEEVETYRRLGKLTGRALEQAADRLEIGMSENQVSGILAGILLSNGIIPHVLLVAADERISKYRHPIPKDNRIERVCMMVVGAKRSGLICSASRLVHFGKPSADLLARHEAVCAVDAALISHTIPGETVGDALRAGIRTYSEAGYPDEWKLHHQGGPTGYRPREFRAHPESPEIIAQFQPFAWNPTITGTKSEDTVLAAEPFPEVLTLTSEWPTVEVRLGNRSVARPAIMVK